jgi:hypothetical protein
VLLCVVIGHEMPFGTRSFVNFDLARSWPLSENRLRCSHTLETVLPLFAIPEIADGSTNCW